ncbi:MAG: hypothetical protein US40_C0002G0001 [Candidatus Roizmanbacteria bacterium GW2011_GWC2_37_13]|uniref:Uncharacterized protein n=1 Tax=Candidatus Roizmanbacteria bacterium GW2011_GWC2_37_13 TaxID=1618486 RepID=A0A0G0G8X4_9BACT|nr:MAG: hypothetical protein US38_C0006G0001 [Candidatus Roizmanbacteria bacterium GW2011_GWC1_37_12]KKQ26467.1 MAG: hypothetical protein US40_C0002G0001 [Candidatus Roizmanbacteria bacterium GW2011_GWC2_37_13]
MVMVFFLTAYRYHRLANRVQDLQEAEKELNKERTFLKYFGPTIPIYKRPKDN